MEIQIKKASPEYFNELFELILKSQTFQIIELGSNSIRDLETFRKNSLETFKKWFTEDDKAYFLAVSENKLIGFIFCMLDKAIQNSMSISDLFVIPEKRKSGVAKKLLNVATLWAIENKINTIVLGVHKTNTSALSLYKKEGFIEEEDDYIYLNKKI